jgi:hypothetical protein
LIEIGKNYTVIIDDTEYTMEGIDGRAFNSDVVLANNGNPSMDGLGIAYATEVGGTAVVRLGEPKPDPLTITLTIIEHAS